MEARAVWQISGKPVSRFYGELFLQYGIALIGPGDTGPWSVETVNDTRDGKFVRRFATEVHPGEIVLLRKGTSRICAVGIVAGDYEYFNQFDDVNGWDLQHGRRVRWCRLPAEYSFGKAVFGANPTRLSRVWNAEVIDYAMRFVSSAPTHWQTASLPKLPSEEAPLDNVPDYLREIVAHVNDLRPLFSDRGSFGDPPTEDELIVHLAVPFLRALGWPPERIAVKWRYVDVMLFATLPRTPENSFLIIEAKRLGTGVEGALEQAKAYVAALGVARDVVVTDGIRYRLYSCNAGFTPVAYANLLRLKVPALLLFNKMRRP